MNPKKSDFRWGISLGGYLLVVGGLFGVVILGGGVDAAARHFLTIAVLVGVFWVPWALGERKKAKLAAEYETQRETQLAAIRKLDGSAHYATPQEIAEAFPAGAGLLFGWVWPRHPESGEWLASQWVRYSAATSIFTIAPAGTGKFVTSIAPALLDNNPQSFFVNDPKGEIYAVTASWRRQLPEHRVYLLDPFAVSGQRTDHYNPLLDLDPSSTNFESDAAVIAGALIYEDGGQGFFIDGARKLVAALLIYVCVVPGERRTLARVLELLNEDEIGFVTVMMKLKQLPNRVCGMAATPFLAKTQSKSTAEVLNTARTQLGDFLPYGAIEEVLSDSDFAISDLKQRGMTVYVVLPQGEALRFNRFTRLLFGWAFKKLQETPATKGRPPACLLIDEMGTCIGGNFELFQKQFALSRGFGFQIWAVFQDIPQAIDVFGEQGYRSALGNAGVLQFFATGEETTVEYIQKRAGTYTHVIDTGNAGFSSLEGGKAQTRAVPLLSQQHIQSLPKGEAIVFRQGFDATFSGGRKHYLEMPEYAQRAAPNPFAV